MIECDKRVETSRGQPMPETPPAVAAALDRLKEELGRAAGTNLAGLILYGGLARGRYRPGKSDVNVVVLLRDASAATLTAIAPALRTARRAANVVPLENCLDRKKSWIGAADR